MTPLKWWLPVGVALLPVLAVVVLYRWTMKHRPNYYGPGPDPLRRLVLPPSVPDPGMGELTVGVTEDWDRFTLSTLYNHILIAGATGAGKGSALWSLVLGLAPWVREGSVRLWGVDPKGGMELGVGGRLFEVLVTTEADAATVLEAAVASLHRRAERLRRQGVRRLTPTVHEPHIVIVIDELGALTAWVQDPKVARRINHALSVLLSQGRAVGVSVIGATQDARKEVLGMRDLFPTRVALRTTEAEQADLILGRGALDRGAWTHRIRRDQPGVAYVLTEERARPLRVRFCYPDDDHIRRTALAYVPAAA